jgi:integrase
MQKQRGYIFRAGDWWYIKYRDTVIDTDPESKTFNQTIRKQQVKKLTPVAPEDQRLKRPPETVLAEGEKFLRPINEGTVTPESTQTLVQFVENVYFPYAEQQKRASTVNTDRNRWDKHLRPRCSNMRLREFRTVTGERLLQEIARQNDLSKATLKQLKSLLSAIFKHAKRQGFIDGVNPMQDVSIPKARKSEPTYAYSLEELNRMLAVLDERSAAIIAVAGFSGLRRSEIQGLRWSDYSTQTSSLRVERSVWEGIVDETKTQASNEAVPVISALAKRLDKYRTMLGTKRKAKANGSSAAGSSGSSSADDPIFATSNGQPLRLNNVLRSCILPVLNRCEVCGKGEDEGGHVASEESRGSGAAKSLSSNGAHAGQSGMSSHPFKRDESLPAWRGWHAFRRGLATNLHDLGVDDHTIKAILRHSSVTVTQRSYIKSLPKHSIEAMNTFDELAGATAELVHKRDMHSTKRDKQLIN